MCGIAGVVRLDGAPFDREALERMARVLAHRGPDALACGSFAGGRVGLAHARLAIIDLRGGGQPMAGDGGSPAIVFNGEIYDHVETREDLRRAGAVFRTASDTEVILRAYEAHGTGAVPRLRGMFAFAIHDASRRRTILARDRLGKKPLYWCRTEREFLFASEIKAILAYLGASPEVDWSFLGDYLALGYIPDPATPFKAIRKLPPGHLLVLEGDRPRIERYWSPPAFGGDAAPEDIEDRLEAALQEAVDIRLRSDVEFGALLSSGLDSGLVAALMCRSGKLAGRPRTFTVGFAGEGHNELGGARMVAGHLGTDHGEELLEIDVAGVLPRLAWHMEEPFADSSTVPTWHVCAMAARRVKMVLSGDGGDELFGGYGRYGRLLQLVRLRRLRWAAALLDRVPGMGGRIARIRRLLEAPLEAAYGELVGIYPPGEIARLGIAPPGSPPRTIADPWRSNGGEPLDRAMAADLGSYLPGDVLVKVDRMAMAHSLEVRSPLLDHRVVELAASIPARLKRSRPDRGKDVLRALAGRLLPPAILGLPKRGFSAPVDAWYGGELREPLLWEIANGGEEVLSRFDRQAVDGLLDPRSLQEPAIGERLFALHTLLLWHRLFVRELGATFSAFSRSSARVTWVEKWGHSTFSPIGLRDSGRLQG